MWKNSYGTRKHQLAERAKFWLSPSHAILRAWHQYWLDQALPAPEPFRGKAPEEPSPPAAEEPLPSQVQEAQEELHPSSLPSPNPCWADLVDSEEELGQQVKKPSRGSRRKQRQRERLRQQLAPLERPLFFEEVLEGPGKGSGGGPGSTTSRSNPEITEEVPTGRLWE